MIIIVKMQWLPSVRTVASKRDNNHYWKMGPKGQKKKYKVWVCRGCSFRRLLDDEFREAVAAVLGSEGYEPRFVKEVAGVTAYEDRFEFHFTEGGMAEWQRK